MDAIDVVVVGSLNMDLVAHAGRLPGPGETVSGSSYAEYPGGKGLNQAVAAARAGARVALVGAVGADDAGAALRSVVRAEGIDDTLLHVRNDVTGRAMIAVDESGENSIIVIGGANAHLSVDALPPGRVVLAQLETNLAAVEAAFRIARRQGAITVLNPAPAVPLSNGLLGLVDVLVPNEHEIELLGGVETVTDAGVQHVIITRGKRGAEHFEAGLDPVHVPPFRVTAVDTTGAGDAFCGALACRLALRDEMHSALSFAAAAGALATTQHGAVPSQATRDRIEALLAAT